MSRHGSPTAAWALALAGLLGSCSSPPKKPTSPSDPAGDRPSDVVGDTLALDSIKPGSHLGEWRPVSFYVDAGDKRIGARFVHEDTKFTLDYLQIESAPQGYLWVGSYPTSDKGEPHTQEHLLLGKGDRGRRLGSAQAMSLVSSSAFTEQWHTAYHFHTVAGTDAFWPVFAEQLGAMLDPDYTDEEIRREVRNFGVDKDASGTLRLEEKGTVYNEMVRSYESPMAVVWRAGLQLVYGAQHPLAYEGGGYPDTIRTMTPADIRAFHTANYHLANMGIIAAFPKAIDLDDILEQTDAILAKANHRTGKVVTEADLPKPPAPPAQKVTIVDYPFGDATTPSPAMLVWTALPKPLDLTEQTLRHLFLGAVAGDESTTLYKVLVDSKTRTLDLGVTGIGAYPQDDLGQPIFVTLGGIRADAMNPASLESLRAEVHAQMTRIANLPDGDPELAAIEDRVRARVIDLRRQIAKFLDSPPGFGIRGTGAAWFDHLHALSKTEGVTKSVTLKDELRAIEAVLAAKGNPWKERMAAWGLIAEPYVIGARPSPALRKQLDADRDKRIADELARLQKQYNAPDAATTLAKYQADYDAQSAVLEAAAAKAPLPEIVTTPPMTLDDNLAYATTPIGAVPAFTATIDSMQSTRISYAFTLDRVPADLLMYLSLLPTLLTEAGIGGATPIASDVMKERLRTEVLELSATYDRDLESGRDELVISGAGNNVDETHAALAWIERVIATPDWTIANLPRLRDVVDQSISSLRQVMKGAEEAWVRDPHEAWWRQGWPLHLHTHSFLTQAHDLHRLRWQLMANNDPTSTRAAADMLQRLAGEKRKRADYEQLAIAMWDAKAKPRPSTAKYVRNIRALSPDAARVLAAAGKDLQALLAEVPDDSLVEDWAYLCKQMAADLTFGPAKALAALARTRDLVISTQTARIVRVGSASNLRATQSRTGSILETRASTGAARVQLPPSRSISDRLRTRMKLREEPRFVGLVAPGTSSGVFINSASSTSFADTSDDAVLDYLSSNQYVSPGAHSLFMKTWAAGLAYSNGVRVYVERGQLEYYAERCPLLPQTLRFVIDQLKRAKPDANIARYAIAKAFKSRIAEGYESRAWAMAADLVDGRTPDKVRALRTQVLAAAKRPDLAQQLFDRMPEVYGKVIPGYGTPAPDGVDFVIGPTKQLDAYADYLTSAVGGALRRLYPRDYWVPAAL
ncbi:MAG: hypothetical protein AB7T06_26895 [Kofleriaceae bacterium]